MHKLAVVAAPGEPNLALSQGEQCVVASTTHVGTWMKLGPPLPHDNSAGFDELTTERFDAEHLRI